MNMNMTIIININTNTNTIHNRTLEAIFMIMQSLNLT